MINQLKKQISNFERQNGRVPLVEELATLMKLEVSELLNLIHNILNDDKCDGTSAFFTSMRELLLGQQAKQNKNSHGVANYEHKLCLVDEDDVHLGFVSIKDAFAVAREKDLELFIAQPDANLPLARLMDQGRYRYNHDKQAHSIKKKNLEKLISSEKEIRLTCEIADGDYNIKLRKAHALLERGNQIKLLIPLNERNAQLDARALALMNKFASDLGDTAVWSKEPQLKGKLASMLLSPSSKR